MRTHNQKCVNYDRFWTYTKEARSIVKFYT